MNKDLELKIEILSKTKLFLSNIESAPFLEKQAILLTLVGKRPVSLATTARWVEDASGRHTEPNDHSEVAKLLSSLGLKYQISDHMGGTDAVVSNEENLLKRYLGSSSEAETGKLMGAPKSAAEAFSNKDLLMPFDEQEALMNSAGLPEFMPSFRFSKANYKQEIETLKDWHETITKYGFI